MMTNPNQTPNQTPTQTITTDLARSFLMSFLINWLNQPGYRYIVKTTNATFTLTAADNSIQAEANSLEDLAVTLITGFPVRDPSGKLVSKLTIETTTTS